jgi:hypothetical protein
MTSFVVECFWVGVTDDDLRRIDERAAAAVEGLDSAANNVRYLGSVLMREDEVVLCFFEGTAEGVRHAAQDAAIPFERIVETAGSPWADRKR